MSLAAFETTGQDNRRTRDELRVSDLWLKRPLHWVIVAVAVALGLALGFLYTWHAPVLYTASATVKLNQDSTGVGLRDFSGASLQTGTGPEFMLDMLTLQEVLTSDATAGTVIDKLHLLATAPYNSVSADGKSTASTPKDPNVATADQPSAVRDRALAIFKSGLNVSPVKNTRLMTVSYSDTNPTRAADIANSVVLAYTDNMSHGRGVQTTASAKALKEQIAQLRETVENNARAVSDLEERTHLMGGPPLLNGMNTGSYNPNPDDSPDYQRLKALEAELTRIQIVRIGKESVYRSMEGASPDTILQVSGARLQEGGTSNNPVDAGSRGIELIQNLRNEEAGLKLHLSSDQVKYGSANPIVVSSRQQIQTIDSQIKSEVEVIKNAAKTEYELALSQENALKQSVADQQHRVSEMGTNVAKLAFLQQEENSNRQLFQTLSARLEEASVQAGVKSTDTTTVNDATPPSHPSSPILKKNLALGMAAGLILGYLIGLLLKLKESTSIYKERTVIA